MPDGKMQENYIDTLTDEHVKWLLGELKRPNGFNKFITQVDDRKVVVKTLRESLRRSDDYIIYVPKSTDPGFANAWIKVFNRAIQYLEDEVNKYYYNGIAIPISGSSFKVGTNTFDIPFFGNSNVGYVSSLSNIVNASMKFELMKKTGYGVDFSKSSVLISNEKEVLQEERKEVSKEALEPEVLDTYEGNNLIIRKVADGDKLTSSDLSKFRDDNVDLVFASCLDIKHRKNREVFEENIISLKKENFNVASFIYGSATTDELFSSEIKKIYEALEKVKNYITDIVIYQINDDYLKDNAEDKTKIIKFIEMFNKAYLEFKNLGYFPLISMNTSSKKIVDDVTKEFDLNCDYDAVYMAIPREMKEIDDKSSYILVDPLKDHDEVSIKNSNFIKEISGNEKKIQLAV